jgi:hypothetical protein
MVRWFSLRACFALMIAQLGCTATCLRDSDCMGASICTDNRCLLIVGRRGDAGRAPATSTDSEGSVDDGLDGGSGLEADAASVNE